MILSILDGVRRRGAEKYESSFVITFVTDLITWRVSNSVVHKACGHKLGYLTTSFPDPLLLLTDMLHSIVLVVFL